MMTKKKLEPVLPTVLIGCEAGLTTDRLNEIIIAGSESGGNPATPPPMQSGRKTSSKDKSHQHKPNK